MALPTCVSTNWRTSALLLAWLVSCCPAWAAGDATIAKFQHSLETGQAYRVVWEGRFRRFDAEGKLEAEFPSRIEASFDPLANPPYTQTNTYRFKDGRTQVIESSGEWDGTKLVFDNDRIEGWSADLDETQDPMGRSSMLYLKFKDGSGMYMYEIITLSDDGNQRARMAQYLVDGKVVRRTLIDEALVAESWE